MSKLSDAFEKFGVVEAVWSLAVILIFLAVVDALTPTVHILPVVSSYLEALGGMVRGVFTANG